MSGGSFDYLYAQEPPSYEGLEHMAAELEALGYASDAAAATRAILRAIGYDDGTEPLRAVWQAVEWWRSNDSGETDVREALARYRGVELPPCQRCSGSGKEPGTTNYACRDEFCEHGRDTRDIGEPGALRPGYAERVEHVSDAYATVDAMLGRARLALLQRREGRTPGTRGATTGELARREADLAELEALHEHLRLALVGTHRERATREQVEAARAGRDISAAPADRIAPDG